MNDHDILIGIKTTVEFIQKNMVTHDQCSTFRAQNGYARSEKALTTTQKRLWGITLLLVASTLGIVVTRLFGS